MRALLRRVGLVSVSMVLACSGGSDDTDDGGGGTPGTTEIVVDADVVVPTTWTADHVYRVTRDIQVTSQLTVAPGTTVKLEPSVGIRVTGRITADGGAAATPVVFTSASPSPAARDWSGLVVTGTGSIFRYCSVLYAGAEDAAALRIEGTSATVSHCTFAHHRTTLDSIAAAPALDASSALDGTALTDNLFFDDRVPLSISAAFSVDDSNRFDDSAASPSNPRPSKYNAVVVDGCSQVTAAITWGVTRVPLVVGDPDTACGYVVVSATGHLTVASGATVKFFEDGRLDVQGRITASAAAGAKVTFTSFADDASGGDTNADGTGSAPSPADWAGIALRDDGSTFVRAHLLYAGGGYGSALDAGANAVTVTDSVFAHVRSSPEAIDSPPALDLDAAAVGTVVARNRFFDNTVPLVINPALSLDDSSTFDSGVAGALQPNRHQAVVLTGCGQVLGNVTWSLVKVPLVVGDPQTACSYFTVQDGGHLTLADGVVLKFFPGGWAQVNGTLTADGTTAITFTSYADDAHGGDTNADGAATTAHGGDWDGFIVTTSGSVFDRSAFLYAGGARVGHSESALLFQNAVTAQVTSSTFGHVRVAGERIDSYQALNLADTNPTTTVVTGNTFFDCTVPLGITGSHSLDDSNVFTLTGQPASRHNAVVVADSCPSVGTTASWAERDVPFVIGEPDTACVYMTVQSGAHLTLGPGVTLKFFPTDGRLEVNSGGVLTVDPTAYLTAIADDHLGDTNADGSATVPAPGAWLGVRHWHAGGSATCDGSAYVHHALPPNQDGTCAF